MNSLFKTFRYLSKHLFWFVIVNVIFLTAAIAYISIPDKGETETQEIARELEYAGRIDVDVDTDDESFELLTYDLLSNEPDRPIDVRSHKVDKGHLLELYPGSYKLVIKNEELGKFNKNLVVSSESEGEEIDFGAKISARKDSIRAESLPKPTVVSELVAIQPTSVPDPTNVAAKPLVVSDPIKVKEVANTKHSIKLSSPMSHCTGYSYSRGFQSWHSGIDWAKREGCWITAAADGKVISAGWDDYGKGYHVVIDHGDGYWTEYLHGDGQFKVEVGDQVSAGREIMYMGTTGNSTGTHLHFGLRYQGNPIDPAPFL